MTPHIKSVVLPGGPRLPYLVDLHGQVHRSGGAGRDWAEVGTIGGQPAAFVSHGRELYVALHDGTIKRSTDGGRSWHVRVAA